MKAKLTIVLVAWMACIVASAHVKMPQLFQNGMVLQRGVDVPVWGWAEIGESIDVSLFDGKGKLVSSARTVADDTGRWSVSLPCKKIKTGGPYCLSILATNEDGDEDSVFWGDVQVGDVWLLSGQSNIDVTIERVYPWYTTEIDSYENPQVRLFRVQNETSTSGPRDDIRPTAINWKPLTKQNAWLFSAVGYFLGKQMQEQTGVPQGIIVNSWGGTPIEAWVSADSLRQDYPMLVEKTRLYDNPDYVRTQARANQLADQRWNALLNEKDPGYKEVSAGQGDAKEHLFTQLGYDDSDWTVVNQWSWGWRGVGSIWLRQHVNVDKEHAGQPARLLLGTLFDADYTFVNGKQVGVTYYQYPPRRYDIPEGLLREGDNVITIRFINKYGMAHFIKEKSYLLAFGDDRFSLNPLPKDVIPLGEEWRQHEGATMPSCPSSDVSLQNLPTTLYNAVLHPLAPYALAGVVWYQGESNTGANARDYAPMLRKLMGGWRQLFQQPKLPFVIVQLANYMDCVKEPQNTGWSQVREAQRTVARDDAYAESVVNIDLGETVDIHPLRKKEVAERVALCFDRLVYGKKVNLFPQVISVKANDGKVVLTLDQILRPGQLKYFELAGSDERFHNVEAVANGNNITLTAPMADPSVVRYAWKDNPLDADAYSLDGLPLGPFEWRIR
jgi:sialate O-acetylesterase